MSGYDELELAIVGMRERFFSIGERISGLLATLAEQIDAAPAHARTSIGNAARQIAGTQQRLRAQMAHLPPRADERYRIMQSLLQAQEGALQQLTIIVDQHAPQPPYQGHAPAARPSPGRPHGAYGPAGRQRRVRPERRTDLRADRGGTLLEMVVSRRLAVIAAVLVAAVAGYMYIPGLLPPREHPRPAPTAAANEGDVTRQDEPSSVASPAIGTEGRRLVPMAPGLVLTQPAPVRTEPVDPGSGATLPSPGIQLPPIEEAAAPTAGVKSVVPPAEIETGAIPPAPQRFVAVVFTHQDRAEALGAFADLQQRYPGLLARRKPEAQPVEIGDKGTWHRLVVLPAGSRQSAVGLCDQLHAAGYDRCWVKAY